MLPLLVNTRLGPKTLPPTHHSHAHTREGKQELKMPVLLLALNLIVTQCTCWFCRYLKSGPGNLEKDVERRFSYALSREDIENAVLGGP